MNLRYLHNFGFCYFAFPWFKQWSKNNVLDSEQKQFINHTQ